MGRMIIVEMRLGAGGMSDGGDMRRLVLKTLTFIFQPPFIISPEAEDVNTSVPTETVTSSTTTGALSTNSSTLIFTPSHLQLTANDDHLATGN